MMAAGLRLPPPNTRDFLLDRISADGNRPVSSTAVTRSASASGLPNSRRDLRHTLRDPAFPGIGVTRNSRRAEMGAPQSERSNEGREPSFCRSLRQGRHREDISIGCGSFGAVLLSDQLPSSQGRIVETGDDGQATARVDAGSAALPGGEGRHRHGVPTPIDERLKPRF